MRYIELIFCKLAWLKVNTSFFWIPKSLSVSRSFGLLLFPIFSISISLAVLVLTALNIKIEMSHLLIFGGGLITLFYLPIELYLKREMKRRRIVYNKEYMQDRQGTVLTVIYTLTGVIVPVLMFLTAWGVKNGRNLLCNSELSSNFAPA